MSNTQRSTTPNPNTSADDSQPQADVASENVSHGYHSLRSAIEIVENQPSPLKPLEEIYNQMLSDPASPSFGKLFLELRAGMRELKESLRSGNFVRRDFIEVTSRGQSFKFDDFETSFSFFIWLKMKVSNDWETLDNKLGELLDKRSGK